jgi:hypothetical protein
MLLSNFFKILCPVSVEPMLLLPLIVKLLHYSFDTLCEAAFKLLIVLIP